MHGMIVDESKRLLLAQQLRRSIREPPRTVADLTKTGATVHAAYQDVIWLGGLCVQPRLVISFHLCPWCL